MSSSTWGSTGLWSRLAPHTPSTLSRISVSAASTAESGNPPAPKKPMSPARAMAITSSADAMPPAIAPAT